MKSATKETELVRPSEQMTPRERVELSRVARMNAVIAKKDLEAAGAEQLALIEQQLARQYRMDHEAWNHITEKAKKLIDASNKELKATTRKMKIPESFAPSLQLGWNSRGENWDKVRRAELRKAAQAAVAANVKLGQAKIERAVAKICTELVREGLTTQRAQQFLATMPTPDDLLPKLELPDLEQTRVSLTWKERRLLGC